jgi:glycosyltransferase involved in cell wall biosynthesis
MNVLIFTPAVKSSAIGRMARLVTSVLTDQGHDVTIVRSEGDGYLKREPHDFGVELISWRDDQEVWAAVSRADLVVYQIGDNFDFHEGCLHWLPLAPGVVCLHDFFVGHLFHTWKQQPGNEPRADSILRRWYGETVAKKYLDYPDNAAFILGTKDTAPLTEWIVSQALGVVTHSEWGAPRVRRSCPGPVRVIPLAYDAPGVSSASSSHAASLFGQFNLLTIGYINENKRVAKVIEAIAASPLLRQNVVYRLVGHIEPHEALRLSALANGLRVRLVISGEVSDAGLAQAVNEADAISCLRWPSLEAASASAIEAMLYGKAVMVTDTGFYSEIPDDCVEKISIENEVDNIGQALQRFYDAPEPRQRMGARARRFALQTYSADRYAHELLAMSATAQKVRPLARAKAHFVDVLTQWGASSDLLRDESVQSALLISK